MKWARRLPAAVVFLILGYAVNAWAVQRLADWHVRHQLDTDPLWVEIGFADAAPFVRDAFAWSTLHDAEVWMLRKHGLFCQLAGADNEHGTTYWAMRLELGVPFRCVRVDWKVENKPGTGFYINLLRSQLWSVKVPAPKAIAGPVFASSPMSPWIWWGVLLDSVIYALPIAGAWYLTKAGVCASVRAARREKGLCPRCSYDVRGLDQCPECGESLARRRGLCGRRGGSVQ